MYRDPDGCQRGKTFATEREARRFLERNGADLQRGQWRDPTLGKQTVAEVAGTWRAQKAGLRPGTLSNYDSLLTRHLLPMLGPRPIGKITPSHVREWVGEMRAAGVGETTLAKAYRVLGSIFEMAVEDRLVPSSPMPTKDRPRPPERIEMMFLTAAQVVDLADAIGPWYGVLVYTAAYTGLRWGEITGLAVSHVDPLHQRIAVVQQLVDTRGRLTFAEPKTKAGRRIVEVPQFVGEMLTDQIAGKHPGDLVFTTAQNAPLRQANFRKRVWLPALRRVGLTGLRFHDLRHTHVALSIAAGAEMLALTRRLGHTRTSFTLDRYGHLLPGADKAIADGLERVHRVASTHERPVVGISRLR